MYLPLGAQWKLHPSAGLNVKNAFILFNTANTIVVVTVDSCL